MEKRHVIVKANVRGDSFGMPAYAVIDPAAAQLAGKYSEAINKMKNDLLSPYRVSQFFYGTLWTETMPAIGPELAKHLYITEEAATDLEFDMDESVTVNSIEELAEWIEQNNHDMRLDCETIDCDEDDFYISCYGKYCGTPVETSPVTKDNIRPMESWIEMEA